MEKNTVNIVSVLCIVTNIFKFYILHKKGGSISTPIYAVCTKVYNMHNSKGLKLCNFAKVYKVHKTISMKLCNFAKVYDMHNSKGLKLCNFAKMCNLYIFPKKICLVLCKVHNTEFLLCKVLKVLQKCWKFLCNMPKRSPVLCFLHKILRKCWKFLCNMEKIRVLQPE